MLKELALKLQQKFWILKSERLARYIFSKRYFSVVKREVKYGAFMPSLNKNNNILETSIFRISRLSINEIWDIGRYVQKLRKKELKAAAKFLAITIDRLNPPSLIIKKETSSHSLHANIIGWDEKKEKQIQHALQLRAKSILLLLK